MSSPPPKSTWRSSAPLAVRSGRTAPGDFQATRCCLPSRVWVASASSSRDPSVAVAVTGIIEAAILRLLGRHPVLQWEGSAGVGCWLPMGQHVAHRPPGHVDCVCLNCQFCSHWHGTLEDLASTLGEKINPTVSASPESTLVMADVLETLPKSSKFVSFHVLLEPLTV